MNVNAIKSIVARLDYWAQRGYNLLYRTIVCIFGRLYYPIIIFRNKGLYIKSESYFPQRKRKSTFKIIIDQLFWVFKYGDINKYYFIWGGDCVGTKLNNFIPWFRWSNARQRKNKMPQNPTYDFYNQVGLLRDKFYFETILKRVGYLTPTNLVMINDGKLYPINTNGVSKSLPLTSILDMEIDAFCKKNVGYGGGYDDDVFPLKIHNRNIFIRGKLVPYGDFENKILQTKCSWVIQERINNQATFMSQFHPTSINTIRIVTVKYNKEIIPICSFARFGVNSRGSDNWSSGGVLVGINIQTGKLEDYALYKPGVGTTCSAHPNTGITFKNQVVPNWENILSYVKTLHELFYDIHSIGWDVCLTTDGPMIIEGNDNWDTIDAQFYGPAKDIYNKYFR